MKITKEEFQRIGEENSLELFYQGIKTKGIREKYNMRLKHFLDICLRSFTEFF